MRELRSNIHPLVAKGWHWPLSLQRMRTVSQDERDESAISQATTAIGKTLTLVLGIKSTLWSQCWIIAIFKCV